jgi:hypothetical protein
MEGMREVRIQARHRQMRKSMLEGEEESLGGLNGVSVGELPDS